MSEWKNAGKEESATVSSSRRKPGRRSIKENCKTVIKLAATILILANLLSHNLPYTRYTQYVDEDSLRRSMPRPALI